MRRRIATNSRPSFRRQPRARSRAPTARMVSRPFGSPTRPTSPGKRKSASRSAEPPLPLSAGEGWDARRFNPALKPSIDGAEGTTPNPTPQEAGRGTRLPPRKYVVSTGEGSLPGDHAHAHLLAELHRSADECAVPLPSRLLSHPHRHAWRDGRSAWDFAR